MRRRRDAEGRSDPVWPVMVSTVLLSGAVAAAVAAATMRLGPDLVPGYGMEPPPRIAGVRLAEMTAAWTTQAAAEGVSAEGVRAWGAALETALDRVAERHGVVLLPARAVAAGAPDMTPQVEAMLSAILAGGGAAPSSVSGGERP